MRKVLAVVALFMGLAPACWAGEKIVVGVSPFPHKAIMQVAAPLLEKEGYTLVLREFSDYVQPNMALSEGSLDANYYQHIPYLEHMNSQRKLGLVWVAKVHIEPLGLYSRKIKSLDQLKKGDSISLPSDPSNGARALRLLEAHGLIKLKEGDLVSARDVVENPLGLKLIELEAPQLPRTLADVTAAVINTNFAAEGGLVPTRDAIIMEDRDSPYANVLVVREQDRNKPSIQALVRAVNSPEVKAFIETDLAPKGILPAF